MHVYLLMDKQVGIKVMLLSIIFNMMTDNVQNETFNQCVAIQTAVLSLRAITHNTCYG